MVDMSDVAIERVCINEEKTTLSLCLARMIVLAHQNKNRQGSITLSNNSVTGGSVFKVLLL